MHLYLLEDILSGKIVRKETVLEVERANKEIRKNFFSVRAAKAWNEIPEKVKNQNNVNGFKNASVGWKKDKAKKQQSNNQNDRAATIRKHDNEN